MDLNSPLVVRPQVPGDLPPNEDHHSGEQAGGEGDLCTRVGGGLHPHLPHLQVRADRIRQKRRRRGH